MTHVVSGTPDRLYGIRVARESLVLFQLVLRPKTAKCELETASNGSHTLFICLFIVVYACD